MRVVIQRAKNAKVEANGECIGEIRYGAVILIGFEQEETEAEFEWLANKILNLRIFPDEQGAMNKSLLDCNGDILLVSQFTLHASTKKGNRPSYIRASKPNVSMPYYEKMITLLEHLSGKKIQTGMFGADMQVSFTNDGPVTIIIDTKKKDF